MNFCNAIKQLLNGFEKVIHRRFYEISEIEYSCIHACTDQ